MPLEGKGSFQLDHDHVIHVTTDVRFASLFAAGAAGGGCGDLYEVEVEELSPDPDTQFDACWLASAATVLRVVRHGVTTPDAPYRTDFWPLVVKTLQERQPGNRSLAPGVTLGCLAAESRKTCSAGASIHQGAGRPSSCGGARAASAEERREEEACPAPSSEYPDGIIGKPDKALQ
jgi:hypothetical protein